MADKTGIEPIKKSQSFRQPVAGSATNSIHLYHTEPYQLRQCPFKLGPIDFLADPAVYLANF